jgi:hypothetical protein
MHIQRPVWKNELNITTVIALVLFVATVGGWFYTNGQTNQKYDSWIANHEELHRDRMAVLTGQEARTDQRLTALEAAARKLENIEYRMTVQEQGSANLAKSVEELKNTVNSLGTDIRVIREIVERSAGPPR